MKIQLLKDDVDTYSSDKLGQYILLKKTEKYIINFKIWKISSGYLKNLLT